MGWARHLSDDDEERRRAALRELQAQGPEAGPWLSNILDHLSGLDVDSGEWGETWRAAARVAATGAGARVIRERLDSARRDPEIRGLLMVVMNLPQDLWPSGDELLRAGGLGGPTTRGLAIELAVAVLPRPRALDAIMSACDGTEAVLRMWGYKALVSLLASEPSLLGERGVLAALAQAVTHGTEGIRREVVQRIASPPLTPEVAEVLASALHDQSGGIRGQAARALLSDGHHRDAAIGTMAFVIADDHETESNRCDVIDDLPAEAVRLPEIASALRKALEARSANLRSSAEEALARGEETRETRADA